MKKLSVKINTDIERSASVLCVVGDIVQIVVRGSGSVFNANRNERWVVRADHTMPKMLVGNWVKHAFAGYLTEHFGGRGGERFQFTFNPGRTGFYIIIAEVMHRGLFMDTGRQVTVFLTVLPED